MTLLLAPLIAVAALSLVGITLRLQRGSQRRLVGSALEPGGPARATPSILYFTGAACSICHTAQRPALRELSASLDGAVEVREIDVAAEPELARRYRVLSLPTTVILDATGTVTRVNIGFADAGSLRRQLVDAGLAVAAA